MEVRLVNSRLAGHAHALTVYVCHVHRRKNCLFYGGGRLRGPSNSNPVLHCSASPPKFCSNAPTLRCAGGQFGAKMRQLQSLYAVERFRGPAFLHSVPRHCSYEPPNQSLPHIYSQQLALHGARDPLALDADQYRPRGADQKGWAAEDRGPPTTFPRLSTHYQFVQ